MPSECFFLDNGAILCYPREIGDGRYPYQTDGLTLWAYSSGNMEVGESMNDCFSGSGSVLIKLLIGGVFGVRPTLDHLEIRPSSYMPCKQASISIPVKGAKVHILYKNEGNGARTYKVNGTERATKTGEGVILNANDLVQEITVEIID